LGDFHRPAKVKAIKCLNPWMSVIKKQEGLNHAYGEASQAQRFNGRLFGLRAKPALSCYLAFPDK